MPRVLALFAKRGLMPRRFIGVAEGAELTIDIQVADLTEEAAEHVAHCLRQIVEVERVLTAVKLAPVVARLA